MRGEIVRRTSCGQGETSGVRRPPPEPRTQRIVRAAHAAYSRTKRRLPLTPRVRCVRGSDRRGGPPAYSASTLRARLGRRRNSIRRAQKESRRRCGVAGGCVKGRFLNWVLV